MKYDSLNPFVSPYWAGTAMPSVFLSRASIIATVFIDAGYKKGRGILLMYTNIVLEQLDVVLPRRRSYTQMPCLLRESKSAARNDDTR